MIKLRDVAEQLNGKFVHIESATPFLEYNPYKTGVKPRYWKFVDPELLNEKGFIEKINNIVEVSYIGESVHGKDVVKNVIELVNEYKYTAKFKDKNGEEKTYEKSYFNDTFWNCKIKVSSQIIVSKWDKELKQEVPEETNELYVILSNSQRKQVEIGGLYEYIYSPGSHTFTARTPEVVKAMLSAQTPTAVEVKPEIVPEAPAKQEVKYEEVKIDESNIPF